MNHKPVEFAAQPGWSKFHMPFGIGSGQSAFGESVRLDFYKRDHDGALVGQVWFGDMPVGPPGHAHGGAVAYILDEAMGSAVWLAGRPSVAGELTFKYLAMTPLKKTLSIEAWIEKTEGRKSYLKAFLKAPSGQVLAEGQSIFVVLPKEKIQEYMLLDSSWRIDLDDYPFLSI